MKSEMPDPSSILHSPSSPPAATPDPTIQESINPAAPAPHPDPSLQQSNNPAAAAVPRRRTGKISRFPKEVRDHLNEMLEDGLPYAEIIQQLGDWGQELTEKNLTTWRQGGHQEWLQEQKRVDSCRTSQELAIDLVRERQGIDSFQAPGKIAAALICEALADIGADTIRAACKTNPSNLVRMLNSLARLTSGGLKCEQHLVNQADRKAQLEKQQAGPKPGGITAQTRETIEQQYRLFPPRPRRRRPGAKPRRKRQPASPADTHPSPASDT